MSGNLRAALRLESIGDNVHALHRKITMELTAAGMGALAPYFSKSARPRPYVARLTGFHPAYRFAREFLRGQKDYSQANSVGSRGVYVYYALPPGLYEVQEILSWKNLRRYYLRVEEANGAATKTEISREEAEAWLQSSAASV